MSTRKTPKQCDVIFYDGSQCTSPNYVRGKCHRHYYRMKKGEDLREPFIEKSRKPNMTNKELRKWIESKLQEKHGCKLWTGTTESKNNNTGVISVKGKKTTVRRFYYQLVMKVELSDNEQVYSTCNNSRCLRIDHLYVGGKEELSERRTEYIRNETDLCVIESCSNKRTSRGAIFCDDHFSQLVPLSTRNFDSTYHG